MGWAELKTVGKMLPLPRLDPQLLDAWNGLGEAGVVFTTPTVAATGGTTTWISSCWSWKVCNEGLHGILFFFVFLIPLEYVFLDADPFYFLIPKTRAAHHG